VRDGGELNASLMQLFDESPTQHEAGCWRFKRDRRTGEDSPHIPKRQRFGDVCILDRSTVVSNSRPDFIGRSVELERHQSWMPKRADNRRGERPEPQSIAGSERRRSQPMLGPNVVITGAEDNGSEVRHIGRHGSRPTGQTRLKGFARWDVHTLETRRQRCRVVGDDQIARAEQLDEVVTRDVAEASLRVDGKQLRRRWPLNRTVGGNHAISPTL